MTQVVRAHTLGSRHSHREYIEERRNSNRYHSSEEGWVSYIASPLDYLIELELQVLRD